MARQKLNRIRDIETMSNIIQVGSPDYEHAKGQWREMVFQNENPITLELGCGKGEYTVGLASKMPGSNFVGVDIKGPRIWVGAKIALEEGLENVRFLRTHIHNIDHFLEENEVDDIWVPFPDPRMRLSDERRRLTGPRFLETYRRILKPTGWFRLKTDNDFLYDYTLKALQKLDVQDLAFTDDLYNSPDLLPDHFGIQTYYESKYLTAGIRVKYLKFRFN